MLISKLEREERIKELSPLETLKKIGFKDGFSFCDIGAGTGIFSVAAAQISKSEVFAVDISDDFLKIIDEKCKAQSINNVLTKQANDYSYDIKANSVDFVFMCCVFHEIFEHDKLFKEIERIKKADGRVVVIEFHDYKTQSGPPLELRIGKQKLSEIFESFGYKALECFDLGENFYLKVF